MKGIIKICYRILAVLISSVIVTVHVKGQDYNELYNFKVEKYNYFMR